jgi:hypothetical protein
MTPSQDISVLMQYHNVAGYFKYDLAVDWAIELIRKGFDTDNILILASFSKPVDSTEIRPYVSAVLNDLGLEEKSGNIGVIGITHFYLQEILNDNSIRLNLFELYKLCIETNHEYGLSTFYLIHCGWEDLEDIGVNNYCEGNDPKSILETLRKEAKLWINQFITGNK